MGACCFSQALQSLFVSSTIGVGTHEDRRKVCHVQRCVANLCLAFNEKY
jgi:hypothetical protein